MSGDPGGLHAEYMFGLLGYSTWNIYDGREFLGQVTLNATDRSVMFFAHLPEATRVAPLCDRSFTWWMKWLRVNRAMPL